MKITLLENVSFFNFQWIVYQGIQYTQIKDLIPSSYDKFLMVYVLFQGQQQV